MSAPGAYDVAIVGGGHNGLVAAAYLARAGRRVIVLERRPIVGGAAVTEEFAPGFRTSTAAMAVGLLRPEVVRDLELVHHGLRLHAPEPAVVSLGEDGKTLRLWKDMGKTQRELARFSTKDAQAFPRFFDFMIRIAQVADPLMVRTPPIVSDPSRTDLFQLGRRAWQLRKLGRDDMYQVLRFAPMPLQAFLGEWFETDLLKGTLAADGLFGTFRGPWSPGTAFGLLHFYLAFVHGGWNLVQGGMGSLANALAAAARKAGATIRTDAPVRRIVTDGSRATGVQLASGETISARMVASNADPKRTFLQLVDPKVLDADFVNRVRHMQSEGCTAKVDLALNGLPDLPSNGGGPAPAHLRIAPSLEYIERAYDDAKYGRASEAPLLDIVVPTLGDATLAPAGHHVMSIVAQYAPHCLRTGIWEEERERLGDRVVEVLDEAIPGLREKIVARQVLTPADLEERFGLTHGHPHHGEMTLNQQYVLRPVPGWARYRTPVDGLYLCGSGAHPGGGVTGAPGYNAAREMLLDLKRARRT